MFSRAAKSVVQSFNQRSYHVSKTHFKNISGKIENTSYKPSKILQLTENAEPYAKKAILPFKNLKFQNLVKYGQEPNTLASVERSPTGGKFPALDISQAVDRHTAGDTLKRISVTGALAPLGDAVFKLLARIPYEQYFQVGLNATRTHLNLAHHHQLSASINKDKVEELKARIKDVLGRIRKKLEELQKQRAKQASAGKKEPSKQPEKEPAKAADKKKDEEKKSEEKKESKPPGDKEGEKAAKDPVVMAGSSKTTTKMTFSEGDSAFLFADRRLEFYSIIIVPGLPPKLSNKQQLMGASDRPCDFKRFTYFD